MSIPAIYFRGERIVPTEGLPMIINMECKYEDYLGEPRLGRIVAYEFVRPAMDIPDICILYIRDILNEDYNDKQDIVNGIPIVYADIRQSTEIELLER